MKKITNNIAQAALGLMVVASPTLFSSCDDFLDLAPQGTSYEVDSTSIDGLVTAAYQGLECHFANDNNLAFAGPITNWIFDVRSDDAYKGGADTGGEGYIWDLEVSNFMSDNASALDKWKNNYYGISRVHKAMRQLEAATTLANRNVQLAEMKTLRAYFYFDLIRVFERIVYFDENEQNPSSLSPYEYTRDEIFNFIKKDLTDAYNTLPETQDQVGRVNKFTAAAILAKVYAFTASVNHSNSDWDKVIEYCDTIISSKKYELYDNYGDMSKVEFDNKYESIFAIQFAVTSDRAHYNYCNILNTTVSEGNVYGNGDDFFLGSQNLVNAFRTDDNGLPYYVNYGTSGDAPVYADTTKNVMHGCTYNVDPRLDYTVGRIGMPFRGANHIYNLNWCRAYNIFGEYSGKKGLLAPEDPNIQLGFSPWGASGLNFCLIRYADILLLKAEALIETGEDLEGARQLINDVRKKAQRTLEQAGTYTPVDLDPTKANYKIGLYPAEGWTQDYARHAVRMERRLELAMEGNRWFDLLRWGTVVDVVNKYMQNESQIRSYYDGMSITNDEVYLPIPVSESDTADGLYTEPGK